MMAVSDTQGISATDEINPAFNVTCNRITDDMQSLTFWVYWTPHGISLENHPRRPWRMQKDNNENQEVQHAHWLVEVKRHHFIGCQA